MPYIIDRHLREKNIPLFLANDFDYILYSRIVSMTRIDKIEIYIQNNCSLFFMEIPDLRTWIFLYLISSVALLWAAFLSAQGVLLGMSVILVLVVIGTNFFVVFAEIRRAATRKEMMQRLSKVEVSSHDENDG
ncbi:hypothetical protein [Methanofollis ethanolicus]|uniref:hypothetical protein n=1 Tax=Methanofollis ethanolicus TaxID=488124 RepID=UPI001F2B0B54|nr:hypothetical protein [Methanofollis ethanolicus]